MNYPTGMGAATGMQYEQVAAEMQAYLRGPSPFQNPPHIPPFQNPPHIHPHVPHFHGPFPARPHMGPMFGPFGHRRMNLNPRLDDDPFAFGRLFVRDLLS